jgi:hypothetical protein
MKKATSSRTPEPTRGSLRAAPEVNVSELHARRNPYAAVIERDGVEIVHDGPSAASLAEIPEVQFDAPARRSPYAERLAAELRKVRVGRGRPRAGEEVGATSTRSIRLSAGIWDALEAEARRTSTTLHAVLRAAVTGYLRQRVDAVGPPVDRRKPGRRRPTNRR